jgi:hypothetical protein
VDPETLTIVYGACQSANFNLTPITRTGIHFTDGQGAAKMMPDLGKRFTDQLNMSGSVAVKGFGHHSGPEHFG